MKTLALLSTAALLTGCSTLRTLEPNSIPIEVTHVSHLTQHAPFTSTPHSYGYNSIAIGAKWVPLPHLSISVSEGLLLEREHVNAYGQQWCGSLMGPREVFTGKIAYEIPLK